MAGLIAAIVVFVGLIIFVSRAPTDFPDHEIVRIKSGTYLSQAADLLVTKNVIRSSFMLKLYVMLMSGHRQVQAGDYLFDKPQSSFKIAYRLINGDLALPKIKVTLTEGLTSKDVAAVIKKNVPNFDVSTFVMLAKPYEGMLFPDTYYFYPTTEPDDVIQMLRENFTEKVRPLLLDVQASGRSLQDIVTMASIVEREATSTTDREMIAGILWKRIKTNMPLQVDPPFYYLLGKDSAHITVDDLAIDSPYNLYKHTGLPPTPIDNPGLDAITATLHPVSTDYWFFLSDRSGRTHYAVTYDQHTANRRKYLE